uniref:Uncharacterized protein n=1 Tax=Stegastes partitus TaxID=144197 RepID=A0A3B4ZEX7_9TELE
LPPIFSSCPEGNSSTIQGSKVALAVAVIKNKPPGMSGRAYAEALACKLKSQDESWKEKAQGLQQEVLRLRQEMLIARATSNTKSSTEAGGRPSFIQVWSVEPDSETPELLLQPPEPTIPLPRPLPPSSLHGNPREDALSPPVQFLQSLCALHRVEDDNRGLEALWFIPGDDAGSVLADTVCQLLDSVVTAFKDPPAPGPRDLVLQACQAAARAMDLFCSQRLPSVEFMRRVEEPLRELTRMLLHGSQPSRVSNGSMGSTRYLIITVATFATCSWKIAQDGSGLNKFPVDQYQNSCHLFSILEALLQKSKVSCRLEVGSEQMAFLSHLEQRAFLLSDEFPLFSIRMWRIGGLLKSSD